MRFDDEGTEEQHRVQCSDPWRYWIVRVEQEIDHAVGGIDRDCEQQYPVIPTGFATMFIGPEQQPDHQARAHSD